MHGLPNLCQSRELFPRRILTYPLLIVLLMSRWLSFYSKGWWRTIGFNSLLFSPVIILCLWYNLQHHCIHDFCIHVTCLERIYAFLVQLVILFISERRIFFATCLSRSLCLKTRFTRIRVRTSFDFKWLLPSRLSSHTYTVCKNTFLSVCVF